MGNKTLSSFWVIIMLMTTIPLNSWPAETGFRFNNNRRAVTIPITVRNNLAVIPLEINNRGPFYFILDTGVKTTILTEPMVAHFMGLEADDNILIYGLGGEGLVEGLIARNVTIGMRGITGYNKNMIIIPEGLLSFSELFGFPVYGIIGYDFFKQFAMRINYSREYIKVFRDHDYRVRRRSQKIPLKMVDGKPYIKSKIIGSDGDTLSTYLLMDMGASHPIYLNNRYMDISDITMPSFLGKGISGYLMGNIGRVKKVMLGETEIKKPLVSYPDADFLHIQGQKIEWEGIIGGEIIKRHEIILDYPREKLIMRPGINHGRPFNTSLTGLEVAAKGETHQKFIIHYVRPGSTGYESGIWAGDRIMAINNIPYTQLTMEDVLDKISGTTGSIIRLTIQRDYEIITTEITLREDLP